MTFVWPDAITGSLTYSVGWDRLPRYNKGSIMLTREKAVPSNTVSPAVSKTDALFAANGSATE